MKRLLRILLFIIVMGSGALQLLLWTKFVEPKWGTVEVIEAQKDIDRGQVITASDVRVIPIKTEQGVKQRMSDTQSVIGQEATRLIRAKEQITSDMLIMDRLTPGKDQFNMPIPIEWILSMPGSLLRGDHITLLPVKQAETTSATTDRDKTDGEKESGKAQPIKVSTDDVALLSNIAVSYSKSSNNQEVTASDDRKKPSGTVNRVEIIVDTKQRDLIAYYGSNGFKYLVTYH